ncbi:FAD-dependent monooxygenase [Microbispora sp. H11081]|uniref:FAD-dependent monooxygenase n=1 Tax=Microbispora sp. H11081 TaxID=2729107 RepID=UPI00147613EB|nr:FAD-dependent monooxygenase [Microbispora sp. H11081]
MSARALDRVAVAGAGAAGAFFTLELSRLRPDVAIDLYDREDRSPGAGIVMSWEFAERVGASHPGAFDLPRSAMATWDRTLTVAGGERIWSGAYGMFGLSRRAFRAHLRSLVRALPNVRFVERTLTTPPAGHDLLVAADGANSRMRAPYEKEFGTRTTTGRTRFLWMSTPAVLEPTFVLRPVDGGLLIVHSYPHADGESTFIVEADPGTLARQGLLDRPIPEVERALAEIFADELGGAPLRAQTTGWRAFPTISNERWHHTVHDTVHHTVHDAAGRDDAGKHIVLIGDAAHTVHFSIGSGTALAIDDALCLARSLAERPSVAEGLAEYAATRRPVLRRTQQEAHDSQRWFETLSRRERLRGHQTVFALRSRREANTFERLRERDPEFVGRAVEVLAGGPTTAEPAELPITIGHARLTGRMVHFDGHAGTLLFPTSRGDDRCQVAGPEETLGHRASSVVLVEEGRHADPSAVAGRLRATGASAVGLLVSGFPRRAGGVPPRFDFLAVPAQEGAGRVERTRLADRLRYETGLPVLLLSPRRLPRDEINTLLVAGRIDMVAFADAEEIARVAAAEPRGHAA